MNQKTEVAVIGAGQAGLAMSYHLTRRGIGHRVFDGAASIGQTWRTRWDSLRLFTPAAYSALPGRPFPGDPAAYPTKDEVADYLEEYAADFRLPVQLATHVGVVHRSRRGYFDIETSAGEIRARSLVVATGPFQKPVRPSFAAALSPVVAQVHSADYRAPDQLPDGPALVVGGGNSGVQIAAELAMSRPTALAVGERLVRLPQMIFRRSVFWWLERTRAMYVTVGTPIGRRASRREMLIGGSPREVARDHGVRLLPRAIDADRASIRFADGSTHEFASIVWATGFRAEFPWLHVDVFAPDGQPRHVRGVAALPGLYFLGLPWLHTRGSALLGWVGLDAAYLADCIASLQPHRVQRIDPATAEVFNMIC